MSIEKIWLVGKQFRRVDCFEKEGRMCRSYKKFPVHGWACYGRGAIKKAKRQAAHRLRRRPVEEEIPSGGFYKKFEERWAWPDDGKVFDMGEKWLRK